MARLFSQKGSEKVHFFDTFSTIFMKISEKCHFRHFPHFSELSALRVVKSSWVPAGSKWSKMEINGFLPPQSVVSPGW